jgi:hypothetical protein
VHERKIVEVGVLGDQGVAVLAGVGPDFAVSCSLEADGGDVDAAGEGVGEAGDEPA